MSRHRSLRESTVARYDPQRHAATVNSGLQACVSELGEQATPTAEPLRRARTPCGKSSPENGWGCRPIATLEPPAQRIL